MPFETNLKMSRGYNDLEATIERLEFRNTGAL